MRHTLLLTLFSCFFITFTSAQDLTKSRVAFVSFSGNVSSSLLDGLDSYEPQTDREKDLERRVSNRLEKIYQDRVFDLLVAKLDEKGIKMLPLEVSNNVAKLNYRGYPNPISSKTVIKKKNKDFADYFLNVTISCDKPILGGLLGFKPEARVKIAVHDATGQKLKTIDETVKAPRPIKRTDFDEPWNSLIDEFDKLDWFYMPVLVDMLMPTVESSIVEVLNSL